MATPDLTHPLVASAYALAARAHAGQFRRDGVTPYLSHIEAAMLRAPKDEVSQAVAALHDVLEDTRTTIEDLYAAGMTLEVVEGVICITRLPGETYEQFIERIKHTCAGRLIRVKIADLLSNLSDTPTDAQIRRYAAALLVLLS